MISIDVDDWETLTLPVFEQVTISAMQRISRLRATSVTGPVANV